MAPHELSWAGHMHADTAVLVKAGGYTVVPDGAPCDAAISPDTVLLLALNVP